MKGKKEKEMRKKERIKKEKEKVLRRTHAQIHPLPWWGDWKGGSGKKDNVGLSNVGSGCWWLLGGK